MKNIIDIRPKDLEIIYGILNRHIPSKTTVWVFGSRAKGKARKFSDLDLVIDTDQQPMPHDLLVILLDDFEESDLPYKVDVVDWNAISESFREIIRDQRKLLFNQKRK